MQVLNLSSFGLLFIFFIHQDLFINSSFWRLCSFLIQGRNAHFSCFNGRSYQWVWACPWFGIQIIPPGCDISKSCDGKYSRRKKSVYVGQGFVLVLLKRLTETTVCWVTICCKEQAEKASRMIIKLNLCNEFYIHIPHTWKSSLSNPVCNFLIENFFCEYCNTMWMKLQYLRDSSLLCTVF